MHLELDDGLAFPKVRVGFAGFDQASTGAADCAFYGAVDEDLNGPEEAGAVRTLQDAGSAAFITGVIGANVAFD